MVDAGTSSTVLPAVLLEPPPVFPPPGHAEEVPRAESRLCVATVVLSVVSSCAVESARPAISSSTRRFMTAVASVESIGRCEVPPFEPELHPTTHKPTVPSKPAKLSRKLLIRVLLLLRELVRELPQALRQSSGPRSRDTGFYNTPIGPSLLLFASNLSLASGELRLHVRRVSHSIPPPWLQRRSVVVLSGRLRLPRRSSGCLATDFTSTRPNA